MLNSGNLFTSIASTKSSLSRNSAEVLQSSKIALATKRKPRALFVYKNEWRDELPIVQDSCTIKIDKQILSRFPCYSRREGIPWLKHSEFPKAIAGVAVKPVLYPFTGSITGVVTL